MSVITLPAAASLPAGVLPVNPHGLLAHVHRPCPEHGGEAVCVGRVQDERCMSFWCERGEHHFRTH